MSDRGIRHFCLNTVYFPYRSRKRDPVAGSGIRSGQILHNQIASVGWSAGARIIIPTIGAGIGHAVAPNDGHSRETYLTVGALIGATVGAAIDVLLIAREEIPLWDREEHARTRPRVVPVLGLGTVGVAGRF